MKKFAWILCFTLLIGMLAGCQTEPADPQPSGNAASTGTTEPGGTQPSGDAVSTGTTVPQVTEPVDTRLLPPEDPGSSLIDYDPDRQMYIASENVYVDYYIGISGIVSFGFDIYSLQKLDPEEISVTFPVDLPFTVFINQATIKREPDVSLEGSSVGGVGCLPYRVYLVYRGETFEEGREVSAVQLSDGWYELDEGEEIEPRYRDFMSLKEEDLPEFYVYSVIIGLYNITDLQETVVLDKLDLTIGGEVYEAKLGCVRLLPQEAFPTDAKIAGGDAKSSGACQPYNDGIFQLYDVFPTEEVPEDITITGLRIAEEATQILDITVGLTSGGQYMEMKWDGASPIYLYKGDSIIIDVTVKNEHTGKLLNYVACNAIVEYTNSANEQLCAVSTQNGAAGRSPWEYYAIIFDGVDMEPYYRNYFYQCNFEWLKEYRGK